MAARHLRGAAQLLLVPCYSLRVLGRWEVHVGSSPGTQLRLEEIFDFLNPRMVAAIRAAHEAYARLGIRHALIGGMAVGVHGHPRATKDIDFLVGSEAFESTGSIVSFRPGVPLAAEGVPVDSILAPKEHATILDEGLAAAPSTDGVPVLAAEYLVYMKLVAGRRQDLADIGALVRANRVDLARARSLARALEPSQQAELEKIISSADE